MAEQEVLALPWVASLKGGGGGGGAAACAASRSAVLEQVLALASDVCRENNAADGSGTAHPVTSEHLFTAMMLHERCIGKHIVEACTDGAVSCRLLLPAMGIPDDTFRARMRNVRAGWAGSWKELVVGGGAAAAAAAATLPAEPAPASLANYRGATTESNWLVPGRVMLGECPGCYTGDERSAVDAILDAGIDTMVCLLEGYQMVDANTGAPPYYHHIQARPALGPWVVAKAPLNCKLG